jgi:predicted porin
MNPSPLLKACIAAASACALQPVHAQSSATVYGRLNVAMEHASQSGAGSLNRQANHRSVLGFRGEEDLGDGLRALWQLEAAVALNTGEGGAFNRDVRVGLAGRWGTAFAGVWTLPYTAATSAFDPFYATTAGYMALLGNGSASQTDHAQNTSAFDRRQVNQVQYWSPTVAGVSARLAYGLNEGFVAADGARPWLASGSVSYARGNALFTVAAEHHDAYQARGTSDTAAKLGVAYQWGPARLTAMAERLRYGTATGRLTRDAWHLSASWRAGTGLLKAGYGRAGNGQGASSDTIGAVRSGAGTGAAQWTLGYDRELSKRTTLFAFFSRIQNRSAAAYDFAINDIGAQPGSRLGVLAVGLRHSF